MGIDYSQGLPTLGFIGALAEAGVPAEIVQLRPDEAEKVKKWVEGPNALNRAQGFMKSAFYQISEGRTDPAARLVISAAVLAGFGWKENPELAARIIETARRVVHHALASKTGAVAGFDDAELNGEMLVLSALHPDDVPAGMLDRLQQKSAEAMILLAHGRSAANRGYGDALRMATNMARRIGQSIIPLDPMMGHNIIFEANRIAKMGESGGTTRRIAGLSFPVHAFDSKGTMWGAGRSTSKLAALLGMLEKVRR
jgi:hypothetical protein